MKCTCGSDLEVIETIDDDNIYECKNCGRCFYKTDIEDIWAGWSGTLYKLEYDKDYKSNKLTDIETEIYKLVDKNELTPIDKETLANKSIDIGNLYRKYNENVLIRALKYIGIDTSDFDSFKESYENKEESSEIYDIYIKYKTDRFDNTYLCEKCHSLVNTKYCENLGAIREVYKNSEKIGYSLKCPVCGNIQLVEDYKICTETLEKRKDKEEKHSTTEEPTTNIMEDKFITNCFMVLLIIVAIILGAMTYLFLNF